MKNKRIVVLFVPRYCYHVFEKWLSNMSHKGWHLVKHRCFIFHFAKGEPSNKRYFMCLSSGGYKNDDGLFAYSMRHPNYEKKYAGKKSPINKDFRKRNKPPSVIEVDESKIDIGFYELLLDRNKWGYLELVRGSMLSVMAFIGLFFISTQYYFKIGCMVTVVLLLLNLAVGFFLTLYNSNDIKNHMKQINYNL